MTDARACLRDELLDREIFYTRREAEVLIAAWRRHDNTVRPHSALGYRPPAPGAAPWPVADAAPPPVRSGLGPPAVRHSHSSWTDVPGQVKPHPRWHHAGEDVSSCLACRYHSIGTASASGVRWWFRAELNSKWPNPGEAIMLHNNLHQVGYYMPTALLLAAMSMDASAATFPTETRYLSEPLHICDQGSFFVGGVPKVTEHAEGPDATDPRQITIGQMYVQFQIPFKQHGWPLIHVHGSTHTGAALESTPDGREGWLPYGVRQGIASYVVDQSGRGRSGFDHSVIHEGVRTGNLDLIPTFGRITDQRAWTAWFGHLIPEGSTILDGTLIRHGDPGDPPDDDHLHPDTYSPAFPIPPVPNSVDPDIEAREGAIGPDVNPANDTYLALEYYKQLVPNGEATLPGSTCPTCDPMEVPPQNTWTPRNLATLVEGLGGAIVATHSQSGNMGHHMTRILKERGSLHLLKALITIEGGCSLPGAGLTGSDFDDIPYLAVSGDYRIDESEQVCIDAVAEINATPTRTASPATFLELDEIGDPTFDGTTHMMMLGTNNIEVFDEILNWVDDNVHHQPERMACAADGSTK